MVNLPDWMLGAGRTARGLARWLSLPLHAFQPHPPGVVVLLYHCVGGGTRSDVDVTGRAFEEQMRYLHQHCRVVSLDTVADASARSAGGEAGSDVVAITFDDGYRETFEVAYPILCRYGLPATIYVPAMYIETRRPFDFGGFANVAPRHRPLPLSWDQIGKMIESRLVAIGSHTYTHADLSGTTPDAATRELDECDEMIYRRIGVTPKHFAYPWGRWSAAAEQIVAARYVTAALGGPAKNPFASLDTARLWRYPVLRTDGFRLFRARMHQLAAPTADALPRPHRAGARLEI